MLIKRKGVNRANSWTDRKNVNLGTPPLIKATDFGKIMTLIARQLNYGTARHST